MMKRIAIITESYVRDAQVFSESPKIIYEDTGDDYFIDVGYPRLYLGIFEGADEDEILKKAANAQGVHPDIISLIDFGQRMKCAVCRWQPMRPRTDDLDEQDIILCPACGHGLVAADACEYEYPEYCPKCGQRLTWIKDDGINENFEFDHLRAHVGHNIETVIYGGDCNVSVECVDCNEVLYSVDNPRYGEETD